MTFSTMAQVAAALPGQTTYFSRPSMGISYTAANSGVGALPIAPSGWATASGGSATYPTASLVWNVPTNATTGALPFKNPLSGASYLARFQAYSMSSAKSQVTLYDRLAQTGLITTSTSTQNLTTTALTRPDSLGNDVELWWECISTPSSSYSATCSYTNQAGVTSRSSGVMGVSSTWAVVGSMVQVPLAAGDTGVRTVESIGPFSVAGAGTGMLVLLRRIAVISAGSSLGEPSPELNALALGLPSIPNNACLALMAHALSGNCSAQGFFNIIAG